MAATMSSGRARPVSSCSTTPSLKTSTRSQSSASSFSSELATRTARPSRRRPRPPRRWSCGRRRRRPGSARAAPAAPGRSRATWPGAPSAGCPRCRFRRTACGHGGRTSSRSIQSAASSLLGSAPQRPHQPERTRGAGLRERRRSRSTVIPSTRPADSRPSGTSAMPRLDRARPATRPLSVDLSLGQRHGAAFAVADAASR